MVNQESVKRVISFLDSLGVPYYIHAGFGLHLRGFSSELDDIDVRVFHEDIDSVYKKAKDFFQDVIVEKVQGDKYNFGRFVYDRVEIETETPVDICTRSGVVKNNIGAFDFPFSLSNFVNVETFEYGSSIIPVASVESLFLYYLILDRGYDDNKDDKKKIVEILNSKDFSEEKFYELISGIPEEDKIICLYLKVKQNI